MRSARILLATAAVSAVLAVTTPGAYAAAGDWDHEDSSYSKEHDKGDKHDDSSYSKEHDKGDKHDAPRGGMHTGGGALTTVKADDHGTAGDPKHDPQTYKDGEQSKDSSWSKDSEKDSEKEKDSSWTKDSEDSWKGGHDKPSGGVHTGGGALSSPAVSAGGLAILAVAGTGLYAARRKKSHGLA